MYIFCYTGCNDEMFTHSNFMDNRPNSRNSPNDSN